jgi:hypothetical protein
MTAFVRTSVVMAVQVAAVAMLTQVAAGQTVEQVSKAPKKYGGYVLADPKCGCPASRPAHTSEAKKKYPTRCLAGNQVAGGVYLPVNDKGTKYPEFTYPQGFPYPNAHSANHPWLQGARTPGSRIAFPGWPAFKGNRTSEWDGGMRKTYIKAYQQESGKTNTPGKLRADAVNKKTGWEEWQIHHILERKHNATDDYDNLVPAYSYPRSWAKNLAQANLNEHSKYTQYWQQIRVDSQFRGAANAAVWDKIKGCDVVKWP